MKFLRFLRRSAHEKLDSIQVANGKEREREILSSERKKSLRN
jgi:hypothetical protein